MSVYICVGGRLMEYVSNACVYNFRTVCVKKQDIAIDLNIVLCP